MIYAVLASTLLLITRNWLPRIYSSDLEVITLSATVLIVIALFQFFDSVQATLIGALRGYKDTKVPLIISVIGYWLVALPLGAVIGYGFLAGIGEGVVGFWVGLLLGLVLVAVLTAHRLKQTSMDGQRIRDLAAI